MKFLGFYLKVNKLVLLPAHIARLAVGLAVTLLPLCAAAEESFFKSDFFIEQDRILRDSTESPQRRTAALRNLEIYCFNAGNYECIRERLNFFLADSQIKVASESSESIANARETYGARLLMYSRDIESSKQFVDTVLGDQFNEFILETLRDLYVANSKIRIAAIYSIMTRAMAHAYRYALTGQGSLAPARDQYLYALGLLLSLRHEDYDHYMILSLIHRISAYLEDLGESALSNRLDRIFMPSIFSVAENDPYLFSILIAQESDDMETRPAIEPALLLQKLESYESRWSNDPVHRISKNARAELCARVGNVDCVMGSFRTAMVTEDWVAAVRILRMWIKYYGPSQLPFRTQDIEQLKQFLLNHAQRRDEMGQIDRLSESISDALITDLHYLELDWVSPEMGAGPLKDKYHFSALATRINASNVLPFMGLSLPKEQDRRRLMHGLVNLSRFELEGGVYSVQSPSGVTQYELTKEQDENMVFFAHALLQRSIASRAAETRFYVQEGDTADKRGARKKLVLDSNEWLSTLLKGSVKLAKAMGRDPQFIDTQIDNRDWGRIALRLVDSKQNKLYSLAGAFGKRHGGVEEYRQKLSDNEAVIISVKAGNVISTACLRKDDFKYATTSVDSSEFALNKRLLELSLTATHPPSLQADSQFPFQSSYYLYRILFQGVEECLSGADHIFYSASLELSRIPPSVLVSKLPKKDLSGGLGDASWLAKKYAFQILDAPDEFTLRSQGTPARPEPDLFLGIADPGGQINAESVSAFRGAPVEPGTMLPPLPNVEREISSIAMLLGEDNSTLLTQNEVSEAAVKAELEMGYRYASFASHALVSGEIAGLTESAILLSKSSGNDKSGDGLLLASEIAELNINSDYLSLSACNTATFNQSAFEENIQGLSNAFKYAGVSKVLSTLWPVETNIAEVINVSTFEHIIESSKPPATALSDSIRAVLANSAKPEYQHPRFWGAFKISGI